MLFLLVGLLFFILGAEFLGVLLLVIYAGAIILLFLFVVFLLNLRTVELYNDFRSYLPVGAMIAVLLWATLCLVAQEIFLAEAGEELESPWQALFFGEHNLSLFGHVLYEHWGFFSILVAVLLLTVMCAVIFITLAISQKAERRARGPKRVEVDLAVVGRRLSVTLWSKSKRESAGAAQKKSSKGS